MKDYLRYSEDVEQLQENEAALIDEVVSAMAKSNQRVFDKHRHATRDAHAKSHGFLKGELRVHKNLPRHLSQGMFAGGKTYKVVVRLSSAPGDIHSDHVPAPRGMAIKVLGVEGERLLADDSSQNQDFLLVNIPVLTFGTVKAYVEYQKLLERNAHSPEFIQRAFAGTARGISRMLDTVGAQPSALVRGLAVANTHILGETFHSMAALRYGDYLAKVSMAPKSAAVKALSGKMVEHVDDSTMRDLVVEHFRTQGAEYEMRAQLCTDLSRMPVEDASVLWSEDQSPQQPVATLIIPQQDAYSPARRVYGDDVLAFNPWRGIQAHRPLGSIMRVRIKAYETSSTFRHKMNAQPHIEPETVEQIPD